MYDHPRLSIRERSDSSVAFAALTPRDASNRLGGVNAPSLDELALWEEHYLKALTETGQWGVVSKFGAAYDERHVRGTRAAHKLGKWGIAATQATSAKGKALITKELEASVEVI